ncbi:MAG TPA: Grx4 family monothiol glutaredoxin [Pseudomonas sp.]|uniref:Grx4 family monothiol glutaredoxin n=1 Tax=Pseudomonas sp. TaxID=306 RepID=UPI002EDAACFC
MKVSDIEEQIRTQISDNPVILFMKGTAADPECGFSRAAVNALNQIGQAFAYVNVLAAPQIREKLPSVSSWPTFPQLFVNGELVGGADIILAMQADGSLAQLLATVSTRREP